MWLLNWSSFLFEILFILCGYIFQKQIWKPLLNYRVQWWKISEGVPFPWEEIVVSSWIQTFQKLTSCLAGTVRWEEISWLRVCLQWELEISSLQTLSWCPSKMPEKPSWAWTETKPTFMLPKPLLCFSKKMATMFYIQVIFNLFLHELTEVFCANFVVMKCLWVLGSQDIIPNVA